MKYAYQIQGALENDRQEILGFRVIVCTAHNFYFVDAPVELFENEIIQYLKFRFKVNSFLDLKKLPPIIQHKIRTPLGRFLDYWVLENTNGDYSKSKNTNA
jgi:hypothetical protein